MKYYLVTIWCLAVILSMLLPVGQANALSKISLELLSEGIDSDRNVGVFVEFAEPTVVMLSTFGGVQPYSSKELMKPNNISTISYEKSIKSMQARHIEKIKETLEDALIGTTYQYAFNGYYIKTKARNLELIAKFPEVSSIFQIKPVKLQRTKTRQLVGAEKVWNEVKDDKGRVVDGKGVLVSVTDTGLDYTHPDFGSQKQPVGSKVVISRDLGMNDNDCQEENMHMHGTACASIIAGDGSVNPKTGVNEKGLAPKALLAGYKGAKVIDGEAYFTQEAAMGSWEYVIKDKIDISSNSWGIPTGEHEHEKQQQACVLVGTTVVCANGNYGTAGKSWFPMPQSSSASANMVIGAGATNDLDVSFLNVTDQSGTQKKFTGMWGNSGIAFEKPEESSQVIDCLWGRDKDFQGLDLQGKVAFIERGPVDKEFGEAVTFFEKARNASNAGASAIILANYDSDFMYATYFDDADQSTKRIPVYELGNYQGSYIRRKLHDQSSWKYGKKDFNQKRVTVSFSKPQTRATVASFSSNGPTKLGFLKPDVCAAGIGVHSAVSKYYWDIYKDYYYDNMGGTSAATPIVAGCAALVKQGRPAWNPYEIKRSLMNTATLLTKIDGSSFLPFVAQGMGRVNVYEAVTTQVLVQPPSALIMADNGKINIADMPEELGDTQQLEKLPKDVRNSDIPMKVYNYSNKEVTLTLSYEINSGWTEQIKVKFTQTEVTIPPAKEKPGFAWIGISVKLPSKLKGSFNDIIVWMTDKISNRRIHAGICVYKGSPEQNGARNCIVSDLEIDGTTISPDGDGINDNLKISYDVVNGSWDARSGIWQNEGKMISFWVKDQNLDDWSLIHVEEEFEPGFGSFDWDGRDIDGNLVLPNGQWTIGVSALSVVQKSDKTFDEKYIGTVLPVEFEMKNSPIKPPPTVCAFPMPIEPAIGQDFNLALMISYAQNVSSIQFKLRIPLINDIADYLGFFETKLAGSESSQSLSAVDFDKTTETFSVSYQLHGDSVNDNAIFLKLKFRAKTANTLDMYFSNLTIAALDGFNKETKIKSFYSNSELSVLPTSFIPADFNRDGRVDDNDMEVIVAVLGSVDGDDRYNWRCDLNYDLKITTDDIAIFSKSYRKR